MNKQPILTYGIELYKNTSEENLLYILAYIIDNCNYNCEYCYNSRPYSCNKLNLNDLYAYVSFVKKNFPNKHIQLELIGGEPTLHPQLLNFCKELESYNDVVLKIFTNLSASIQTYEKILQRKNSMLISSWHSYKNSSSFIDKSIQLLARHKSQIETRIMFEPKNTQLAYDTANELLKYSNNYQFDLSYVFDPNTHNNKLFEYTSQQLALFNRFHQENNIRSNRKEFYFKFDDGSDCLYTFSQMFCNKSISFKHWLCNAGKNSLFIDYDGKAYPCVEYSYDKANTLFDICDKRNYAITSKSTICKLDYCSCDWDIMKRRIFKQCTKR